MMEDITTYDPDKISVGQLHSQLLAAVAPRPIAFASTIGASGNINLSPFSFFNAFSANPAVLVFSPSRRGRDNTTKHTYENILEVPETVINIVNYAMVEQMSLASTEYGKHINEFTKAGFTAVPSQRVTPPRVGEAPVAFECQVDKVIPLGKGGGAGNLVIARVLLMHVQSKYLRDDGILDTTQLDLVARMGGNWYTRASGPSLFEIPKPIQTTGIGVDRLPASVRNSKVLTGNNLGRLGNAEQLPEPGEVEAWRDHPEIRSLLSGKDALQELHLKAQAYLASHKTTEALLTLLVADELTTF